MILNCRAWRELVKNNLFCSFFKIAPAPAPSFCYLFLLIQKTRYLEIPTYKNSSFEINRDPLFIWYMISCIKESFFLYYTDFFTNFTLMSHFLQFTRIFYPIGNIASIV